MGFPKIILIILLIFFKTGYGLVITEILRDPVGYESEIPGGRSHEFVEIINLTNDTLFFDSVFIFDGKETDQIVPFSSATQIHPTCICSQNYLLKNQTALIMDIDYSSDQNNSFYEIEDSTVLFTTDDSDIGNGLSSNDGIVIYKGTTNNIDSIICKLCDRDEQISLNMSSLDFRGVQNVEGYSVVAKNLLFDNTKYVSTNELSPGSHNKHTRDYTIDWKLDYIDQAIICSVRCITFDQNNDYDLRIIKNKAGFESVVMEIPIIDAGINDDIYFEIKKENMQNIIEIKNKTDSKSWQIDISDYWIPEKAIVINEIYPKASSSEEWLELKCNSSMDINLKNWAIGKEDDKDTISASDLFIIKNGYIVLTKDKNSFKSNYLMDVNISESYRWHTLSNYKDTLVLYNGFDVPVDSVYYDLSWYEDFYGKNTVQRINDSSSALFKENWAFSENGSPGMPNSDVEKFLDAPKKPDFIMGPIPFSPNNDGKDDKLLIDIKMIPSCNYEIAIYGFDGRKYKAIKNNKTKIYWDGKSEDGYLAPRGPFFVIINFTCKNDYTVRKKGILWR